LARPVIEMESGTNPARTLEPFITGMPATQALSLIASFLPASGPPAAPLIEHFQYHAFSRF
jgi:hypothetical protein